MAGFSLLSLFERSRGFALDFSDRDIRLIQVRGNGSRMRALCTSHVKVPEGLIDNGVVKSPDEVAALVQQAIAVAKPKPPKTKFVVAGLPESQVFMRHFRVPNDLRGEDLDDRVLEEAKRNMPLDLATMVWDFQVLRQKEDEQELVLAAASSEIVNAYVTVLTQAGLTPFAIEPESIALIRSLVVPATIPQGEGAVILDLGGRGSVFIFTDEDGIQLSITRLEGGNMITEKVAQLLSIALDKAERLKREQGLEDQHVMKAFEKVYEPVIEDFFRARAAYELQAGRKLTRVILSGGTCLTPGLLGYLQAKLNMSVAMGQLPIALEGATPARSAVALGLALRAARLERGLSFITVD